MDNVFTGMGKSPDGIDMPMGFGMRLAQDNTAMVNYAALSDDQKRKVISHVQSGTTGAEAKNLIRDTVRDLHSNNITFI